MKIPTLVIVGRPNVGKSTLFNRLVGERKALVDNQPGVTRDRHYGRMDWEGKNYEVIDTGGYEAQTKNTLLLQIRSQVEEALREADLILFVVDGRQALMAEDFEIASQLRHYSLPCFLVVNKIDHSSQEAEIGEAYRLGLSSVFPLSAEHGRGLSALLEAIAIALSSVAPPLLGPDTPHGLRLSLVGRPNVGKSTLLNRLFGAPRAIVHPEPGTTRDAIEIELREGDKTLRWVDTAGIRRKSHTEGKLEKISVLKTLQQISLSDVNLLLIEACEGITTQDARIAQRIVERFRALVILVNKWDLMPDKVSWSEFQKRLYARFDFLASVPLLKISAKTGLGTSRIAKLVEEVYGEYSKRIKTADLNALFRDLLAAHPPPLVSGKGLNLFFMTQVGVSPPHFVVMANKPSQVPESYKRYLIHGLRARFGFRGSPIQLDFKARRKRRFHRV